MFYFAMLLASSRHLPGVETQRGGETEMVSVLLSPLFRLFSAVCHHSLFSTRSVNFPTLSLHRAYLHPVAIHVLEENAEGVRLGGDISIKQAARSDGQLHSSDAVLRSNTSLLAVGGRAESVGHGLRSQMITLQGGKSCGTTKSCSMEH